MRLLSVLLPLLALCGSHCFAQPCKTAVKIINTKAALSQSVRENPDAGLVSLPNYIPGIVLDIRYATTNNFTHKRLYNSPAAYMRRLPADALKKVQTELEKRGLGLKIYDAYRPLSVTCTLWQTATDKRYVANPRRGSHHNRAIAADLTIIQLNTGKELDMGTGFDNFTDTAHHSFSALPAQVLANRKLLKNLMWKHGFNYVPTEWWHYHWRDKNYDVLDIPFAKLD